MHVEYKPYDKYKIYKTEEEFKNAITEFFVKYSKGKTRKIPTLNALAVHLGMSAETLKNFPNTDFKPYIEHAISCIAMGVEEKLLSTNLHLPLWLESNQPTVWGKQEDTLGAEQAIKVDVVDQEL